MPMAQPEYAKLAPDRSHLLPASGDPEAPTEHPRLILVCAPTGYEKDRVVDEWLRRQPELNHVICVIPPAETLWAALEQALERRSAVPVAPEAAAERVQRFVTELSEPLVLVIKDYHVVTNSENDLALAELCMLNPLLTLVVMTRRVRLLDSALAAKRVPMLRIGPRQLAFSAAELEGIVERFDAAERPHLLEILRNTGGWPLAVKAAIGSAGTGAPADEFQDGLNRFALHFLEVIDGAARRILLAAAVTDAVTLERAAEFAGVSVAEARSATHELLELGLLQAVSTKTGTEFQCHPAARPALAGRAHRTYSADERRRFALARAADLESAAPCAAFALYCDNRAYAEAESLFAANATLVIDEGEATARLLRAIPEAALVDHPALAVARLFLDAAAPQISLAALGRLVQLLASGVAQRVEERADPTNDHSPQRFALLAAAMMAARFGNDLPAAQEFAHRLDAGLPSAPAHSLVFLLSAIADTLVTAGDLAGARRAWRRLLEQRESAEIRRRSPASTRATSDAQSRTRWRIAALSSLALIEMLEGNVRLAASTLAEMDQLVSETGERASGPLWTSGELARELLAAERLDPQLLAKAERNLLPLADRIEAWPLQLVAEAQLSVSVHGVEWSLPMLRTDLMQKNDPELPLTGVWEKSLAWFHSILNTMCGNFIEARALITALPEAHPLIRLEEARIALFSGDDATALRLAQGVHDRAISHRIQFDRNLIIACSAWHLGEAQVAFAALAHVASVVDQRELRSPLGCVPFEPLQSVAAAARDAGICDLTDILSGVPEVMRSARFEPLTEMEQRTLATIAEQQDIAAAAQVLFLTPATVKKHLSAVYRKLRAKGRDEAVKRATRMGLLSL